LSAMYQMDRETFAKYMFQNPGMINNISQQILNEKVIGFLAENNTAKYSKPKKAKVKTEKEEKPAKASKSKTKKAES